MIRFPLPTLPFQGNERGFIRSARYRQGGSSDCRATATMGSSWPEITPL